MKFVTYVILVCFLLMATKAHAVDPVQNKISLPEISAPANEKDIGAAISPLNKGIRAPFTGLLLSPEAIATLMAEISSYKDLLELETARLKLEHDANLAFQLNKLKIELETDKSILSTRLEFSNSRIIDLSEQLQKEIDSRPNVFLWASLGFLSGIGVALLTTFAVVQVSN